MKSSKNIKTLKLTRQAQGTLAKVENMIIAGEYCPNVIQQIDSVAGFLKTLKREMLAGHLDTCVLKRLKENKPEAIKELLKIYNLSN